MASSAADMASADLARDVARYVARLAEENAWLRRTHLEQQRALLLQENARLQTLLPAFRPPPGLDAPPGLEAPTLSAFKEVDAALLAMAARVQGLQDTKVYSWPCSAAPTDAGSLTSSTVTSAAASNYDSECEIIDDETRTTLILRNIPNGYKRQQLLELLDSRGFAGRYDFMYLPIDFNSSVGFGYAFVNFVDGASAELFVEKLQGYRSWPMPSEKVLAVDWCSTHQGFASHIERYRNSPVMHESMADDFKPMLFKDGKRIAFPRPTRKLKAPRVRAERN